MKPSAERESAKKRPLASPIAADAMSPIRGRKSPEYEEWPKDDLYEKAKEVGIEGRSHMDKGELIDALRNH
jgi:hypothetical protein